MREVRMLRLVRQEEMMDTLCEPTSRFLYLVLMEVVAILAEKNLDLLGGTRAYLLGCVRQYHPQHDCSLYSEEQSAYGLTDLLTGARAAFASDELYRTICDEAERKVLARQPARLHVRHPN